MAVKSLEAKLHETINIGTEIVNASEKTRFCRMVMHRTVAVAACLEDELVKMLHQPLYSPNLEPRNCLFLSPWLKITTKGRCYDSSRDTRKSVANILEGIPRKNTRPSRLTRRLLVKIVAFTSNKIRRFFRQIARVLLFSSISVISTTDRIQGVPQYVTPVSAMGEGNVFSYLRLFLSCRHFCVQWNLVYVNYLLSRLPVSVLS